MQAADMGVNGMPTCRFCLKKFHGWQNLKRHITNGRCPAMHDRSSAGASVVPAAETVTTTQPLMQQHALLQRLVDQQLDRDLIASEVRLQILQNCGLCGQWIADARQVKQHIRQGHRDIWNKFHSEVEALLPAFGRSITVPCGFCGTDKINSSNRPRHAKLCGVLFQTLLVLRRKPTGPRWPPKGIRRWRQESPDRRNGKSKEWARAGVTASSSTAGCQDQGLLRSSPQRTWTTIRK